MKLHSDKALFLELTLAAAQHLQVPVAYVEKDYWVTRALKYLSESPDAEVVVFKGGTALSKAYKLINRFSEDIDLAICFNGHSGNQIKAMIKSAEAVTATGLTRVEGDPRESRHGQFRKAIFQYPGLYPDAELGQVAPHILIETNAFTTPEPSEIRPISSLIAEVLNDFGRRELVAEHELEAFDIKVLCVQRTLVEKVFSLIRACREPEPMLALRARIRHVYDICMILRRKEYREFLLSGDFLEMVVVVALTDKRQFQEGCTWLDQPLSESCLFAKPEETWVQISEEFLGNFKDMLYDEDLPTDSEVLEVLVLIFEQLGSSCAHQLAAN
jgi:predicted nucleotidyltransferase component of viral defense system